MITRVVLAKLSPTMEEGTIVKWSKKEGDVIKVGDVLAEIVDRVQRGCFDDLDAPVVRVTAADVPMPYSKILEKAFLPQPERVIEAVHQVLYR